MNPLVSIIVPCFNQANFLTETLLSVSKQTYENWECIIINDGSTDVTERIAIDCCLKDNRFKYFYQSNLGLSSARNKGISESKGEFVQLLDSDDLIEKRKIEIQTEFLKFNSEVDIVYGPMTRFDSETSKIIDNGEWMTKISGYGRDIVESLLIKNIMVVCSPLIRKEVFQKAGLFNTKLKSVEDWELWIKCANKNLKFQYIEDVHTKVFIRTHQNSMMKNNLQMLNNQIIMRKSIGKLLEKKQIRNKNQRVLNKLYGEKGLFLIQNKNFILGYCSIFKISNLTLFSFLYHALYWTKKSIISRT